MFIEVFKSKIHRVTVTASDLNYIGSITIDEDLIDAAGLVVGERVYIVNVNNGERFDTYVIKGKRKSGEICLNGPAARKVQKGDVIIMLEAMKMQNEMASPVAGTVKSINVAVGESVKPGQIMAIIG